MRHLRPLLLCFALAAALPVRPLAAEALPPAPTAWTTDRLVDELGRTLASHFNLDGDLKLTLLRPWTPPAQAASSWQIEVLEFPTEASATMLLRFRLLRDGAVADESSLMVRAALWRDAWYARQPVASGTTFDPSMLESRRIDAFRERDGLPVTAGSSSYIFTRDVPADRLVTWHDLGRRPLVHKGEVVEVIAAEGRLSLTMKALALQNGARGDLITVKNLESDKNIPAQVVDDDRVEIHF